MKTLLTCIILLISSLAYAKPYVLLSMGHMTDESIYNSNVTIGYNLKIYQFKNTTYGGWSTWSMRYEGKGYPFIDIYTIGNKVSYKNFFVDYCHYCVHTVNSPKKPDIALPFPAKTMSIISIGYLFTPN